MMGNTKSILKSSPPPKPLGAFVGGRFLLFAEIREFRNQHWSAIKP